MPGFGPFFDLFGGTGARILANFGLFGGFSGLGFDHFWPVWGSGLDLANFGLFRGPMPGFGPFFAYCGGLGPGFGSFRVHIFWCWGLG